MNNNILTRQELIEYLTNRRLKFSFFQMDRFVFVGEDKNGTTTMMFVSSAIVAYTDKNMIVSADSFADLGSEYVNYMIMNKDLEIIYQD